MKEHTRIAAAAVITALATVVFFAVLAHAVWYAPDDSAIMAPAPQALQLGAAEIPSRLIIPSLNIDAHIQQVGINSKGNMGVPSNFTDVAWYQPGTPPGQKGSAVIDGHVDNGLGLDGVFKHLADLKPGDAVEVETKEGARLRFTVERVEEYPYHAVPTQEVFGASDAARLNLITCDGAWVAGEKTYDHRLIVFTRLSAAP